MLLTTNTFQHRTIASVPVLNCACGEMMKVFEYISTSLSHSNVDYAN